MDKAILFLWSRGLSATTEIIKRLFSSSHIKLYRGGGKALSAARRFIIFRRIRIRITIIHNNARDDDSDDDDAVYHRRREYVVVSKPDSEDYQQRRDRESG